MAEELDEILKMEDSGEKIAEFVNKYKQDMD